MMHNLRGSVAAALVAGILSVATAAAQPPEQRADVPAVPMPTAEAPAPRATIPPRNSGPAARAHSRYRRGRHGTTRIIRRTPDVMREDAARVKRGDLFSTWSNEYLE